MVKIQKAESQKEGQMKEGQMKECQMVKIQILEGWLGYVVKMLRVEVLKD